MRPGTFIAIFQAGGEAQRTKSAAVIIDPKMKGLWVLAEPMSY